MKLRSITLTDVRCFAGTTASLGVFGDGLSVVTAPNEAGKSTFFEALEALFSMPARANTAEVRALRPYAGGAPEVTAEVEIDGRRHAIAKRWLSRPFARVTELPSGRLVAQDDEAERWIRDHTAAGKGAPPGSSGAAKACSRWSPRAATPPRRRSRSGCWPCAASFSRRSPARSRPLPAAAGWMPSPTAARPSSRPRPVGRKRTAPGGLPSTRRTTCAPSMAGSTASAASWPRHSTSGRASRPTSPPSAIRPPPTRAPMRKRRPAPPSTPHGSGRRSAPRRKASSAVRPPNRCPRRPPSTRTTGRQGGWRRPRPLTAMQDPATRTRWRSCRWPRRQKPMRRSPPKQRARPMRLLAGRAKPPTRPRGGGAPPHGSPPSRSA